MTVRYRHPQTGEVYEGTLTRVFPHVHSVGVRLTDQHETVVHRDNIVFITTPHGHKVY